MPEFARAAAAGSSTTGPISRALVSRWNEPGSGERHLLSLLRGHRMKCLLRRMLDETEFLSDYGVRALSKRHEHAAVRVRAPAATGSASAMCRANRRHGAVRRQLELARADLDAGQLPADRVAAPFHHYYGDDFKVECPTGSGSMMTLDEVADGIVAPPVTAVPAGRRADGGRCSATRELHRDDPHFRDHVLFYEYFHGDTGRGLGASHQTGWTGLVALLLADLARDAAQAGDRHEMAVAAE